MLSDSEALGYMPLRESIAEYLRASRGILCHAEQIAIVSSVQQVIDLCARLLLDPGDRAWIEDPGYSGARILFEGAGAKLVCVPVDASGMNVDAGRALAPDARLAYVTAGRQRPLGMPLSLERRLAMLAWAREAGATVIEDDYDSEFRFCGSPLAAMKSLDALDQVVYVGTFSKLLFPALRIAYAVLPSSLVAPFSRALSVTARHAPLAPQAVLRDFIAEGHFGRHLRRMRVLYAERAEALQEASVTSLRDLIELPELSIGLDTPAFLPEDLDDTRVASLAENAGIECSALSGYAIKHRVRSGLQLGFAAVPVKSIRSGVGALRKVMDQAIKTCRKR
jgi:GntR family transcriptional regulator/MocR family aminotransferase